MKRALGRKALRRYSVNRAGAVEELSWSLYDFTTYVLAGQTNLAFFQSPVGSAGKPFKTPTWIWRVKFQKGKTF